MLELLYIGRFDYLAHPNAPDSNEPPNDDAVALAMAAVAEAAREADRVENAAPVARF